MLELRRPRLARPGRMQGAEADARPRSCWRSGGGAGGEGLRAGRRDPRPAGRARLGGPRLGRGRPAGARRGVDRRRQPVIYGKRPVAEAERGRRRVHRVWRAPETSAEELERLCGSPDHQGVVAEVDPYPYADPRGLLRGEDALLVALDQVQDPRNLGAVCRSAEFAGAAGLVIPERRSAEVTAVACKASAGAVEHLAIARVRNLADWLAEAKEAGFWIWGADAEAASPPWDVDLTGPTVLVLGGEGKGIRPRVASACDGLVALPPRGEVDSLNVSAAAAALLFEAVRQRGAASNCNGGCTNLSLGLTELRATVNYRANKGEPQLESEISQSIGRLRGGKRRHDPSSRRRICGSIYAYAGNATPVGAPQRLCSGQPRLTLNLSLMITIWSPSPRRAHRRLRHDRPPLPRLRPPQGLVLLPARRRVRRPDPGGPARPLQGDPRLPHRPRVELPQLRGALHHPPDHHRGEDGDPQQAHAAQPVRLLQPDAGGGGRLRHDPGRDPARADASSTRSTR